MMKNLLYFFKIIFITYYKFLFIINFFNSNYKAELKHFNIKKKKPKVLVTINNAMEANALCKVDPTVAHK